MVFGQFGKKTQAPRDGEGAHLSNGQEVFTHDLHSNFRHLVPKGTPVRQWSSEDDGDAQEFLKNLEKLPSPTAPQQAYVIPGNADGEVKLVCQSKGGVKTLKTWTNVDTDSHWASERFRNKSSSKCQEVSSAQYMHVPQGYMATPCRKEFVSPGVEYVVPRQDNTLFEGLEIRKAALAGGERIKFPQNSNIHVTFDQSTNSDIIDTMLTAFGPAKHPMTVKWDHTHANGLLHSGDQHTCTEHPLFLHEIWTDLPTLRKAGYSRLAISIARWNHGNGGPIFTCANMEPSFVIKVPRQPGESAPMGYSITPSLFASQVNRNPSRSLPLASLH